MTIRNYSNTAAQSTLSASIAATDTSIALTNYAGDPTPPFTAALARGTANEEIVLVTAVVGSTVTVTRGYDGTTAKAQAAGATFQEVVTALDFREANSHVNSGASGAHGTTSQLVGVNDTQTLTNKTLTAPTISSPTVTGTETVATSNVTTLNVSGVSTLAGGTASGAFTFTGLVTANGGVSTTTLTTSGNGTVGGTLGVTGLLTASGGITVPTGKVVTVTDAPSAGTSAANKSYVDGKTWPTTALSDAASAATPSVAVKRDAAGRAQVADPAAAADIATKNYVDGFDRTLGYGTYTSASNVTIPASQAGADVASVSGTSTGKTCYVEWDIMLQNGSSGADRTANIHVYCDSTDIGSVVGIPLLVANVPTITKVGVFSSTPGAGAHTWHLRADSNGTASSVVCYAARLRVVERP